MLFIEWVGPLRLCEAEIDRVPPSIPGVYLLHSYAPDFGGYPVFYAGKSADIRRRLSEHLHDGTTKARIAATRRLAAAYFSAAAVLQPDLLDRIECGLILALEPHCNGQCPTVAPLYVNLPPLTAGVP